MRKKQSLLQQLGQTSIEYLLMLVVSIGLGTTFFKKVKEYLVTHPNSYINRQLGAYKTILGSGGPGAYKRFRVPR